MTARGGAVAAVSFAPNTKEGLDSMSSHDTTDPIAQTLLNRSLPPRVRRSRVSAYEISECVSGIAQSQSARRVPASKLSVRGAFAASLGVSGARALGKCLHQSLALAYEPRCVSASTRERFQDFEGL